MDTYPRRTRQLAIVALNDAVTEYHELHTKLFGVALSVGITRDQWFAIKAG
jgi:hypothetical protein